MREILYFRTVKSGREKGKRGEKGKKMRRGSRWKWNQGRKSGRIWKDGEEEMEQEEKGLKELWIRRWGEKERNERWVMKGGGKKR